MRVLDNIGLDFDDLYLVPQRSTLNSRSEVDIIRKIKPLHGKYSWEGFPVLISNMDNAGTIKMAKSIENHQMSVALHKFYEQNVLINFFSENKNHFYTTGIRKEDLEKLENVLSETSLKYICIDAPNAYIPNFLHACDKVRSLSPDSLIMAGNCSTLNLAEELVLNHGVDIIKAFISPGSHCETRKRTGIYSPTFTTTVEIANAVHGLNGYVCCDGGFSEEQTICKAFAAGGDFVMIGGMVMGTSESGLDENWEFDDNGNKKRLRTYGMSSEFAQNFWYGKKEEYRASEGKIDWTNHKGPVNDVVNSIKGGIRSCATYIGAKEIRNFAKCATFIRNK